MKIINSLIVLMIFYTTLIAEPIAKKDGFGGYVALGVTTMQLQSNMIAGTAFDDDMTNDKIDNLTDKADKTTTNGLSFNFNLKYTLADIQTEFFVGEKVEDILLLDSNLKFGIRKDFENIGIVEIAGITSAISTKVYKDPYAIDSSRDVTDKTSTGILLKLESILDSNFDIKFEFRKFNIDDEESARDYELNREGDMAQLSLAYTLNIERNEFLKTTLEYSDYNLDGDAMKHKRIALELNYLYVGKDWSFIVIGSVADDFYKNKNILFNDKADALIYGGSVTAMYVDPFELSDKLSFTATVSTFIHNSDINFYDASVAFLNLGVLYRF